MTTYATAFAKQDRQRQTSQAPVTPGSQQRGNRFTQTSMSEQSTDASQDSWLGNALEPETLVEGTQAALPLLLPYLLSESIGDDPIPHERMSEQLGVIFRGKEA